MSKEQNFDNSKKALRIGDVIKRLLNPEKLELKALDRYGFVPKEIPNYKQLMSNDDHSKVKGYTDGYRQAMEDILNAL